MAVGGDLGVEAEGKGVSLARHMELVRPVVVVVVVVVVVTGVCYNMRGGGMGKEVMRKM